MTVLSAQSIRKLRPVEPFEERGVFEGKTFGLSACGYDIRIAEDVILRPGEFVLASTMEKFTMPDSIVGVVHDKSSWIREGLCVFNTVIEPGWCGFLTLELKNVHGEILILEDGPHHPDEKIYKKFNNLENPSIRIARGTPIAQVLFSWLDEPTDRPYSGRYQNQEPGAQPARRATEENF